MAWNPPPPPRPRVVQLTPEELERGIAARLTTAARCDGCGAPLDLHRPTCSYCLLPNALRALPAQPERDPAYEWLDVTSLGDTAPRYVQGQRLTPSQERALAAPYPSKPRPVIPQPDRDVRR